MLINDISYFFIIIYEMYICNVFIKKKLFYIFVLILILNVG